MKITNIRTRLTNENISLLADCKIRPIGWDTIYFTFDKKYHDFIYEDASPFAAALLIPCMYLNENLIIDGSISEKLHEGMLKIMDIMVGWNVGMKRINIQVKNIVQDSANPKHVATFFSAGVDSFYTYLKHQKDTKDVIDHFIFINGNDISLKNKELLEEANHNVRDISQKFDVGLLAVETNLQPLLEPMVSPDWTHGGSLAAIGLALRKGLKKIYIPASFDEEFMMPYGSHPDIDKFWSTEILTFDHDGVEASRFHKIEWQIVKSPVALEYLRVCYKNKKGTYNCGECEKCFRTMMALYALGELDNAKTFPHAFDMKKVAPLVAQEGFDAAGHRQNLVALKARNIDPELQREIEKGIANVSNPADSTVDRVFKKFVYLDHRYLRGKLYEIYISSGIIHHY